VTEDFCGLTQSFHEDVGMVREVRAHSSSLEAVAESVSR
jgi:hypothetical protein